MTDFVSMLSHNNFYPVFDARDDYNSYLSKNISFIVSKINNHTLEAIFNKLWSLKNTERNHINDTATSSLKVCFPFPERFGENYKKLHTLFKFLLFLLIPFIIITVYYVLMAKRLIKSTTDIPNESSHSQEVKDNSFSRNFNNSNSYLKQSKSCVPILSQFSISNASIDCSTDYNTMDKLPCEKEKDKDVEDVHLLTLPANHNMYNNDKCGNDQSFNLLTNLVTSPLLNGPDKSNMKLSNDKLYVPKNTKWKRFNNSMKPYREFCNKSLKFKDYLKSSGQEKLNNNESISPSQTSDGNNDVVSFNSFKINRIRHINNKFSNNVKLSKQMESRKKIAKMVLIFILLFLVCWLPYHIFNMWFFFNPNALNQYNYFWHSLKLLGFIFSYLNSCINPIALYFISNTFKKYFNYYLTLKFLPCHYVNDKKKAAFSNGLNPKRNKDWDEVSQKSNHLSRLNRTLTYYEPRINKLDQNVRKNIIITSINNKPTILNSNHSFHDLTCAKSRSNTFTKL
ncbi:unnamed protein product [Gordionus sp. m RMFG-2023]